MSGQYRHVLALTVVLGLLGGCVYTPTAPREWDSWAKSFEAHPSAATIYVYRDVYNRPDERATLYMDGKLVGETRPGTFFRIDTVPARHVFHGIGLDPGYLAVDARAGQIYFVRMDVVGRHTLYKIQSEQVGKKQLQACCEMIENWPGAYLSSVR